MSAPAITSRFCLVVEGYESIHILLKQLILLSSLKLYYPPEVSSMKYCCLRVFRKKYFRLITK